jgi:hypothetical protein
VPFGQRQIVAQSGAAFSTAAVLDDVMARRAQKFDEAGVIVSPELVNL